MLGVQLEVDRVRTSKQDDVNLGAVIHSGGGHDSEVAREQLEGLFIDADMVEDEFGGAGNGFIRYSTQGLERLHVTLGAGVEEVNWANDIEDLVVVEESADVEGSHCVFLYKR